MKSKKIIERQRILNNEKIKHNNALHKKNDDEGCTDPESGKNINDKKGKDHVLNNMKKENVQKIDILASQVSSIKNITKGISRHMKNEESLL